MIKVSDLKIGDVIRRGGDFVKITEIVDFGRSVAIYTENYTSSVYISKEDYAVQPK